MMHACAPLAKRGRNKVAILVIVLSIVEIIIIFYLLRENEKPKCEEVRNGTGTGNHSFCKCLKDQIVMPTAHIVQQIKTEIQTQSHTINHSISALHQMLPLGARHNGPPIYLLETSFIKRHLTAREACTIESAARHHPMSLVTLYTVNGHFNWHDPYVKVLNDSLRNFRISPLNLTQLFNGTPLAEWHRMNVINTSSYPVEHLSDACRIVILWKHGGIYLDTDAIAVNTLHYLRNTVGLENDINLANAFLIFDRGHPVLTNCMKGFVEGYRGKEWGTNGPTLVTRVLRLMCNVSKSFEDIIGQPQLCHGVTILPRKAFTSLWWEDLFRPKLPTQVDFSDMYTVHLWSKLSKSTLALAGNGTLIDHLFKLSCPAVYQQILTSVSRLF